MSAAEPPQSANSAPSGGSEAAKPRAWGGHTSAQRTGEPLLAVTHLVKHYALRSGLFGTGRGVVHAVDDVSFTIGEGETLGLVGESGCGKSTIARTVLGLTAPTAGAITWRGERIDRLPAATMRPYRQALQAVFQDPYASLNPRMRAADIVAEPIRNFETASAGDIAARVLSLFQRVGLRADQMPRYPYEFSGGQRQRLGIARALAPRPKLIVCDEPVSALDVSVQAQVISRRNGMRACCRSRISSLASPVIFASASSPCCIRSVSVAPGLMALMRTPLDPYVAASPTVASISAAFAAPPGR
jgi:ABC-type glutathione transport system ATPase component